MQFKLSQMKMNGLIIPFRDNILVEHGLRPNGACRRYAGIYQTHFVPDGTFLTEASIFYQYDVPKGTSDNLNFCCTRISFSISKKVFNFSICKLKIENS